MSNTFIMLSTTKYIKDEECFDTLKDIIKPNMSIVCLPYACDIDYQFKECRKDLTYNGSFWNEHYNYFKEYGIDKGDFYVATPSDNIEFIKWKLDKADIIYFSGGSMKNLKFMLQALDLWDMIKQLDNKIFIGESAGSLMLQRCYIVFTEEGMPSYYKGLGLVDIDLFVHYDKNNINHNINFNTMTIFDTAYAISDEGCIVIKDNEITKIGEIFE